MKQVLYTVVIVATVVCFTGCVPFWQSPDPDFGPPRPLNQAEIQQVIRSQNFSVLTIQTVQNATIILFSQGAAAGYYSGWVRPSGLIQSSTSTAEGNPDGVFTFTDTSGTLPFIAVAIVNPKIAQQAYRVTITLRDGTTQTRVLGTDQGAIFSVPTGTTTTKTEVLNQNNELLYTTMK